ncbi:Catalyzes the ferrous insertion into protoporphyrin IX (By similarity) [Musa troglodytarum]|uniref:Ferrochelatase n=1 Tax=Musa troglodytarum TaxID=320322 RepID=A0A9E7FI41_9LILI|nr:Catalyzes the ferrous insertion into protoporphyrin IX (By similarity) [Musa troglodytarum]
MTITYVITDKGGQNNKARFPLYPQFSISTSGSSIRVLQSIIREDVYFTRLPISIIESWYQREGYINSMADLIENELLIFSKPEEVMVFFSTHGVPLSYVEDAGDPYRDQMEDFVSEHIETLEEIDMEYRHLALQSGIENWDRVPALGCTSSFISDLADAVIEALPCASISNTRSAPSQCETATEPVPNVINLWKDEEVDKNKDLKMLSDMQSRDLRTSSHSIPFRKLPSFPCGSSLEV